MTYKACCMLFLSAILAGCSSPEDPSVYSYSSASYEELNAEVGCGSKYSDDKKDDIFNSYYKNHYMTWRGEVILAEADKASLNIDSKGIQDLAVDFAIKNAGYHLIKGQFITVIFVMKHAGGCFLPFMGDHAIIQLEQKELVLSDTAGHDTATRFLEQQLREYESRLIDAENRLTDFKRKNIDADKLDIPPKVEDELKRLTQDYNNNKETYEQLVQRLESARMSEHVQPALGDTRVESDTAQRFLEQQIREYESRLIEAENRLTDFKRKYIDTLPGQGGGVFARLQEVRVTLQDLNLELKEARIRRDELRRQYEAAERDERQRREAEGRLSVATTPGEQRILAMEARQTIDGLKKQESELQESRAAGDSDVNVTSIAVEELKLAYRQSEVTLTGIRVRTNEYEKRIKALREKLDTLPPVEAELKRLTQDYNNNKETYEQLVQRLESARMSEQMSR